MHDRYVLIVLFVAVIALAGCTDGSSETPTDTTDDAAQDGSGSTANDDRVGSDTSQTIENTIRYTDSGFQPADLTIQQGETVTFIDEASSSMWVASDRHPTHTQYAGTTRQEHCSSGADAFDQCGTGPRYAFTFEKTGSWDYHNHQPFIGGGTITVR